MTVVPLGIDIDTSTAVQGARNLEALVPAAEKVERAVDKMVASALADLKAINERGFNRLSEVAEQSLAALQKMERVRPIPQSLPTDAEKAAKAFDSLRRSVDQAYRAEQELADVQRVVGAALASGAASADQAADALRRFEAAQTGVGSAAGGFTSNIQNAAFQLGDFAVQVGAGTSASVALAQQLPQLLGGFGALGAVLGAGVAILVPLSAALLGSGDAAATFDDRAQDLAKSAARLVDANDALLQSNAELRESYGQNAEAMRRVLELQAGLAAVDFADQARTTVEGVTEAFARLESQMLTAEAANYMDDLSRRLFVVRAALDTTSEGARAVTSAIAALENAEGPEEQARASEDLALKMAAAAGGAENLSGKMAELYRSLVDASEAGFDAAGSIARVGEQTDYAAGAAGRAAAAYIQFQRTMEVAMATQAKADAQAAARQKSAYAEYQQSRRLGEEAERQAKINALAATEDGRSSHSRGTFLTGSERVAADRAEIARARAANRGGGGGGGGKSEAAKEAEKAARELEREKEARANILAGLDQEITLLGKSNTERRIASELRKAYTDRTTDEGKAIVSKITYIEQQEAATERLAAVQEYAAETGADLFTSAISGADGFKDALGGVLAQLGQMAASEAFMLMFMGKEQSGGKGGLFGQIFSSILGMAANSPMPVSGSFGSGVAPPVYANGTNYHPGGPARVHDKGGEIIDLPRGTRVIPHDVSMAMARGGGATQVEVVVTNEGGIRAFVRGETAKSERRSVAGSLTAVQKANRSTSKYLGR